MAARSLRAIACINRWFGGHDAIIRMMRNSVHSQKGGSVLDAPVNFTDMVSSCMREGSTSIRRKLGPRRPLDCRSRPTIQRRARRGTSRCHRRAAELLTRNAPARFSPAALPCDEIPARRPGRCPPTEGREELAYDQPRARSGRHRPCAMPSPGFPKLPDPNTHSSAAPRTGKCAMRGPIPRPRCCVEEARRRIIELQSR